MFKNFLPKGLTFLLIVFSVTLASSQVTTWTMSNIAGKANGDELYVPDSNALESGFQTPGALAMDKDHNIYFNTFFVAGPGSRLYKIDHLTNELSIVLDDIIGISGVAIHPITNVLYFSKGVGPIGETYTRFFIYSLNLDDVAALPQPFAGMAGELGVPTNGSLALETPLGGAGGIKFDNNGENLYYTSTIQNDANFIQRINMFELKTYRVLGKTEGMTGVNNVEDGVFALDIQLNLDLGLAFDSEGVLYFVTASDQIKKIDGLGKIRNIAGNGYNGHEGDGGDAIEAKLSLSVNGIVINSKDELFITERLNYDVRKVILHPLTNIPGIITTFCGTGINEGDISNPSGDLANYAFKRAIETNIKPCDILITPDGDFILSDENNRIRRVINCVNPEISELGFIQPTICKGDTIKMYFDGSLHDGTVWNWYKGGCEEGESLSNDTKLIIVASTTEEYYVIGSGGCTLNNECTVINIEMGCKEYFNTFTPNNDGKNDFFEIPVLDNFPFNTVVIYDRWGGVLYTIENYDNATNVWKGTNLNNEPLDSGTYYFTVVANGQVITSGWVELIK